MNCCLHALMLPAWCKLLQASPAFGHKFHQGKSSQTALYRVVLQAVSRLEGISVPCF